MVPPLQSARGTYRGLAEACIHHIHAHTYKDTSTCTHIHTLQKHAFTSKRLVGKQKKETTKQLVDGMRTPIPHKVML